jgi:hypothetical protein
MNAPRRLWSGDWRQESAALSDQLAERRAKAGDPDFQAAPRPQENRGADARPLGLAVTEALGRLRAAMRRAGRRVALVFRLPPHFKRGLPIALAVLLVLAAGAYGLVAVLGSPARPAAATASHGSGPVNWLGMEIESLQPGVVVVDTVALGSPAELAGMEPGDVIVELNGRPVNSTGDIRGAIAGLGMGDAVEIQVSRGSTRFTTRATLAAPPVSYP